MNILHHQQQNYNEDFGKFMHGHVAKKFSEILLLQISSESSIRVSMSAQLQLFAGSAEQSGSCARVGIKINRKRNFFLVSRKANEI